jgi:hypothetical protein
MLRERPQAFTPHRHIENYVGLPIGERLRQKLEDFLDDHRELDEETALALLLDLGLARAKEDPDQVDAKAVLSDLGCEQTGATDAARRRRLVRLAQLRALCRSSQ